MTLDLKPELAELAKTSLNRLVSEGDIWRVLPDVASATISWKDTNGRTKRQQGRIQNGNYHSGGGAAPTEWVKVFLNPSSLEIALRAGAVLPGPLALDIAVIAPGHTQHPKFKFPNLPQLLIEYPKSSPVKKDWVRYHPWGAWAMSAEPGNALIQYLDNIKVGRVSDSSLTPLAAARQLLAELIGLRTPTWLHKGDIARFRARSRFRRGEFVRVLFSHGQPAVPCLVISDEAVNGANPHMLVVLETIPYEDGDDDCLSLIPLDFSECTSAMGLRTLDPTLFRGLDKQNVQAWITPYDPPLMLTDSFLRDNVHPILEELYVSPSTSPV